MRGRRGRSRIRTSASCSAGRCEHPVGYGAVGGGCGEGRGGEGLWKVGIDMSVAGCEGASM